MKEVEAFPDLPVLDTVALPAFAFAGTFVDRLNWPEPLVVAEFRAAMDDDLDTPRATALLFSTATKANSAADPALAAAVVELAGVLGLELRTGAAEIDDATTALMGERDEARAARDWSRADAIRDQLQAAGWIVEDGPDGTTVRRRA